ncbi:MAG: tetratricopeptide repeat protein [Deltaproteobacteria bacterium]|nr:tetratricopeptide repeat protein [Deltaproteobacteria bacterium]PJB96791.1 MAG: hypothetical protein CO080_02040 [Nitrospirae bacterium CG_4_9_14_0_8_um_filter_70_14]
MTGALLKRGWWILLLAILAGGTPARAAEGVAQAKEFFQTGVRYFNAGKLDQALEAFKKSVELNPRSAETYNNIGAIYHQFGMLDQAETNFQKARQLNPDYELGRYNLARLYLTLARQEYQEVLRLTHTPAREKEAHYYIGVLDQVLGEEGAGEATASSHAAPGGGAEEGRGGNSPRTPPAGAPPGALEAEEASGGNPVSREEIPERPALAPAPGGLARGDTAATLFSQAKIAHANGDLPRAIGDYQRVARLRPDDAKVQYNLGSALFSNGQYDEALVAFDRSVAIDPDSGEVHHFRGATLEKLGRSDEAIAELKRSLALEESYKARWLLGVLYEKAGDYAAAVREFEAVAKAQPENKKIGDYLEEAKMILAMKGGGEHPAGPQPPADLQPAATGAPPVAGVQPPVDPERVAWLERWRQAWQARDLEKYMAFYSDAFAARGREEARSKKDWEVSQRKKFQRGVIQVGVADLRIEESKGLIVFSFVQDFRRGSYHDRGLKKLFVRDEGGNLKIVSEEWHRL